MSNIGVEVSTSIRSGPTQAAPISGRFHIPAITETGPADKPVMIRSMAEFQATFGVRTPYASNAYDTARLFFEEGGAELIVSRVVGPAAAADFVVLKDTSAADTLRVEAIYPGSLASPLSVVVTAAGGATVTLSQGGQVVGVFTGATPADIAASAARNRFVRILDLGSQTAAPGNRPIAVASTPLTGGKDDRENVGATQIIAALDAAGEIGEGGAVAAPGYPASIIGEQLIAHAEKFGKEALLAEDPTATEAEVLAAAEALVSPEGAYGGVFYPHMDIPDGTGVRTISPEGYLAAVRARAHALVGYWRKPIGDIAITRWAIGTNKPVNKEINDRLSAGQVNGIITANGKTRLYNWVSLATDRPNLGSLRDRGILNNLAREIKQELEPFVGQDIDGRGRMTGQIESEVIGIVSRLADADALHARVDESGEEVDPGYKVIVDQTINATANLADNTLNVQVLVRLSPTADLILVEIIKVPLEGIL
ncbi:hypothetical protein ACSYDW_07075 [Paeniglutamicibacter sp. R2-26]|uniref:hypothetical protein n=1 Tax=Paeniglutamicibacter sp. R2-26 TaxID=3144417 RepID=UPI003EE4D959